MVERGGGAMAVSDFSWLTIAEKIHLCVCTGRWCIRDRENIT